MPPAERVPQADGCGACGCTESGPFYRVRHPSKGARVLCEGHARRVVKPLTDGGTKSSERKVSGSTDSHTDRSSVGSETGMVPRLRAAKAMTASNTTPGKGESGDGRIVPKSYADISTFEVPVDIEVPDAVLEEARARRARNAEQGEGEPGPLVDFLLDHADLRLRFLTSDGEEVKPPRRDGGATTE